MANQWGVLNKEMNKFDTCKIKKVDLINLETNWWKEGYNKGRVELAKELINMYNKRKSEQGLIEESYKIIEKLESEMK